MENILSLKRVLENYGYLKTRKIGFPYVGKKDKSEFSKNVEKVVDGFKLYDSLISTLNNNYSEEINLTSGNPMKYKPFKPSIDEMKKILNNNYLNKYPYSEGDDNVRVELLKYIESIGFNNNEPYNYDDIDKYGLSKHNITLTVSTSHAFGMILDIIARPNDVILMPSPNYGLFSFKPERINAVVETLPIDEKTYLINPEKLEEKIIEINKKLEMEYKDKLEYIPKVVAIVNSNPCNPTGKVMGEKDIKLLTDISNICKDNGVFIIDDLVYRDLTFDNKNIAKPIGTIPGMFRNTISLFGLSKSYGLAGLRAGFVVADEIIIRELINKIFQEMDAIPSIIGVALKGAFNTTLKRNIYYKKYFNKLNNEYYFRYNILKAFINGIESVDKKIKDKVYNYIRDNTTNKDFKIIEKGINDIDIKIEVESGFFAVLDFSKLKGKTYNGNIINTEEDLLRFFYNEIKLRFIIGKSMLWPNDNELVGRVTFAKERQEIINYCIKINEAIKKLV